MFEEYMRELEKIQLLTPEEEFELWRKYKLEGSKSARIRLIESYQPLVFKIASPYRRMQNIMDVIQEGTVGLIEAVEKFEPDKKVAFSLYAMHRIRGRMIDYLRRQNEIPSEEFIFETADYRETAQEKIESEELSNQLHTALNRLPAKEKNVLEDIYFREEKVDAVADEMKLSLSHIYRLQKKGMQRIRGMLSRFIANW